MQRSGRRDTAQTARCQMPDARCRPGGVVVVTRRDAVYSPTLTAVFVSSSDALLPPPVLLWVLIRLLLLGAGRTMALIGRAGSVPGDAGGELAMSAAARVRAWTLLIRGSRWVDLSRRGGTGQSLSSADRMDGWGTGLIVGQPKPNGMNYCRKRQNSAGMRDGPR